MTKENFEKLFGQEVSDGDYKRLEFIFRTFRHMFPDVEDLVIWYRCSTSLEFDRLCEEAIYQNEVGKLIMFCTKNFSDLIDNFQLLLKHASNYNFEPDLLKRGV